MPVLRRFGTLDLVLLLAVTAVAAGARVWYLSACAANAQNDGPIQVQGGSPAELDALVSNLKDHNWFGSPAPLAAGEEQTAHVAPGYPWLLYGLQRSPVDLAPVDRTMRWVQCGLGTLTALLYFLFTFRAFGSRLVATLAGLFCALHPYWVINTAEINDGVLTTFLLAACLFFGQRGTLSGGAFSSLLFGLGLAGLALVRAALLPFAVMGLLGFLWRCRTVHRGWLCALLAFLGFANGLASWTFRNYKKFGDVIPVADSTYLHLWVGNNPWSTGGPQTGPALERTLAEARGEGLPQTPAEWQQLAQKERYDKLGRAVLDQVRGDPAGVFKHRLQAAACFVLGAEWFQSQTPWRMASQGREMPDWFELFYPALLYGTLFGMLGLGLLGWRWTYGWRHETGAMALALVWIPLPYILSHAEALNGPRLPLDGVLLCYAAFALACLVPSVGRDLFNPAGPKVEA